MVFNLLFLVPKTIIGLSGLFIFAICDIYDKKHYPEKYTRSIDTYHHDKALIQEYCDGLTRKEAYNKYLNDKDNNRHMHRPVEMYFLSTYGTAIVHDRLSRLDKQKNK